MDMMKEITRVVMMTVGFAVLSVSAFATTLEGWSTDLEKAIKDAKAENKSVLIEFTGSDFCPPCIEMRKNVFSKKEFVEAASKNFILVEVDFPKGDEEMRKKNEPLAEKYKIPGFPIIVLLDSEGKEFTRFPAVKFPKVEEFLSHLESALEKKDLD
jgi:thioredoxin-related protein